ncbi:MAG TPA: hypothetical protein VFB42_07465 [Gaiellaceae bacterium]|nr:hypothetical protein [Gaiellaceae bacterium]
MPPTTPEPSKPTLESRPRPVPPRDRLEELLGRDFAHFLLEALSEPRAYPGRRGSSSP